MIDNSWTEDAWAALVEKVKKTSTVIGPRFPTMTDDAGRYVCTDDTWRWVTGFWPGLLWLLHDNTNHTPFADIALRCEMRMDEALNEYVNLHHDVGFMWQLTSVKRFKSTGDHDARRRGLVAASHLASRFNILGGYLSAWNVNDVNDSDPRGLSIIDSLMNLPLLYWASEETGDPRFRHVAIAHTETVIKHFIRPDFSINHMVEFDPFTGEKIRVRSGQGSSTMSAWSRGTSWAVHGMALASKYTKDPHYLEVAKNVADFFIRELPADNVPHWDFRVPRDEATPRDTSAGMCAACGMLVLASQLEEEEAKKYLSKANEITKSVYEAYGNWDNDSDGIIRGGTFNHPAGLGIDVSLIYGDYYYVEALSRLRRIEVTQSSRSASGMDDSPSAFLNP